MKLRNNVLVSLLTLCLLLAAGCAASGGPTAPAAGVPTVPATSVPTAAATTVFYAGSDPYFDTIEKLAQTADLVVRATAVSSEIAEFDLAGTPTGDDPRLDKGGPVIPAYYVFTVYTFAIADCYKGCETTGANVKVKVLGGELDGVQYSDTEAPVFTINKKYILFLMTFPSSPAVLLNDAQSAYTDETDKDGNYVSAGKNNDLKLPPGQIKKLFGK